MGGSTLPDSLRTKGAPRCPTFQSLGFPHAEREPQDGPLFGLEAATEIAEAMQAELEACCQVTLVEQARGRRAWYY